MTSPRPGRFVFDFGQNLAGVVRLKVNGLRGQRAVLQHAEVLIHPPYCNNSATLPCDGMIYTNNLRSARATDVYVLRGDPTGEVYSPRFTQHGFRFVEVSGSLYGKGTTTMAVDATPQMEDIVAFEMHSDVPLTGDITFTGEPLLNQIQSNIAWGAKSNLMSVPTDCPQRDERFGCVSSHFRCLFFCFASFIASFSFAFAFSFSFAFSFFFSSLSLLSNDVYLCLPSVRLYQPLLFFFPLYFFSPPPSPQPPSTNPTFTPQLYIADGWAMRCSGLKSIL
jgi:hypothetical protein